MKANDAVIRNMQTNMTSLTNSNLKLKSMFGQFMKMNTASLSGLGTIPSNTITNPKEDLKGIITRSGNSYQGPMISTTSSSLPKVVEYALRDKGIDVRVVVEAVDREESKTGTKGSVEVRLDRVTHPVMPKDTLEPAQKERAVECMYETLGSLVQRFHNHPEDIPVHRIHVIEEV
nr:reverse transcriptase domain-containing protein [Tanacetum cinerariifolium]